MYRALTWASQKILFIVLFFILSKVSQAKSIQPELRFISLPTQITATYLQQRIQEWLSTAEALPEAEEKFISWLKDLYLQRGNPNVEVTVQDLFGRHPVIFINEHLNQPVILETIHISGGTPIQRWLVREGIQQVKEGQPFVHEKLLEDLHWLEHNQFLPLNLIYHSSGLGRIEARIEIPSAEQIFPTGNLSLNQITGLALTAGLITDNFLLPGSVFRILLKRNNLPVLAQPSGLVQDWEYVVGASTTDLPWPGITAGFNQYNKVDYIYRGLGADPEQITWIQSFGGDFYAGFPLWSDPEKHRTLRGIANLSVIQDRFFSGPDNSPPQLPLSQSGGPSDILVLPSLNLIYSDLNDFILPQQGHFLRFQLAGSLGDARYLQGTATGFSFWTPLQGKDWQATFVFRNALGTTFGHNVPFYRGFLNTGLWLVRGAREFSITEKHSIRTSQEVYLIWKPSHLKWEELLQSFTGQAGLGEWLDGWALAMSTFLDEGSYWRDNLYPRLLQMSLGLGLHAITPAGSILGVELAFPAWPQWSEPAVLLRISAPLAFTLYADWLSSNGFFLR